MNSNICELLECPHVTTSHVFLTAGRVAKIPTLQFVSIVGIELLLAVPLEAVDELLSSKVVSVVVQLTVHDQNFDFTIIQDLGEDFSGFGLDFGGFINLSAIFLEADRLVILVMHFDTSPSVAVGPDPVLVLGISQIGSEFFDEIWLVESHLDKWVICVAIKPSVALFSNISDVK